MKALLDTHTFLWWNLDDHRLSIVAREFISDGENEVYLSAASVWEIAIKYGKGRLELPQTPEKYVSTRLVQHGFLPLPIQISHAAGVFRLPQIHNDPFDRLLIGQSQLEHIPLLTGDTAIARYDVDIIW